MGMLKICPVHRADYSGSRCAACAREAAEDRPEPPALEPPSGFEEFEFLGVAGKGGMGVVHRVRRRADGSILALKLLPPSGARPPGSVTRLEREAEAMSALSHPNVVRVFEHGTRGDRPYLLMEFIEGRSLRRLMKEDALSEDRIARLARQICDGLAHAHDRGIVHRDVKPDNVLVGPDDRAKVSDFGLVRVLGLDHDSLALTQRSMALGTLHYMAPEQMDDPTSADARADVFSTGVVLYEMLTGNVSFGAFASPLRPEWDAPVRRAVEPDRDRRFPSMRDLRDALPPPR